MPKRVNVSAGEKFNRLTIASEAEKFEEKRYFNCVCDCGNIGIYRFVALRSGDIKSCGCLRDEQNRVANLRHGMGKTSLYSSWHSMKQRCQNQKCKTYKYYGGRGISVSPEWNQFESFAQWALSSGCRWATMPEQLRNTRRNVFHEFNGEKLCVVDWAKKLGISNSAMQKRLKNWSVEKALSEPKNILYAS